MGKDSPDTETIMLKVFRPSGFLMPLRLEKRFGITKDVLCYALYWTPMGDEAMCERIYSNGWVVRGDTDWTAWLELERLNPVMAKRSLGSSEETAEEVLLCDNLRGRFYIIPIHVWRRLCRAPLPDVLIFLKLAAQIEGDTRGETKYGK